jgi:hypothetical protein
MFAARRRSLTWLRGGKSPAKTLVSRARLLDGVPARNGKPVVLATRCRVALSEEEGRLLSRSPRATSCACRCSPGTGNARNRSRCMLHGSWLDFSCRVDRAGAADGRPSFSRCLRGARCVRADQDGRTRCRRSPRAGRSRVSQPCRISTSTPACRAFQASMYPASTARSCRSLTLLRRCASIPSVPCLTARHDDPRRSASRSSLSWGGFTRSRIAAVLVGSAPRMRPRITFTSEG